MVVFRVSVRAPVFVTSSNNDYIDRQKLLPLLLCVRYVHTCFISGDNDKKSYIVRHHVVDSMVQILVDIGKIEYSPSWVRILLTPSRSMCTVVLVNQLCTRDSTNQQSVQGIGTKVQRFKDSCFGFSVFSGSGFDNGFHKTLEGLC